MLRPLPIKKSTRQKDLPFFSIIVRTKNVETTIESCLQSIYNQDFKDFEILLVEHGSNDQTVPIVKKKFPEVKIIKRVHVSLAALRKAGVEIARGKYILFVDADQVLSTGLLNECRALISERKLQAITIAERPLEVKSYLQKIIWHERALMEKIGRGIPRVYERNFYQKVNADSEVLFVGEDKVAFDLAKKNKVNHGMTQKLIYHRDFRYLLPLLRKYIQYGKTMYLLKDKNTIYTDQAMPFLVELLKLAILRFKPLIAFSLAILKVLKMLMLRYGEYTNRVKK